MGDVAFGRNYRERWNEKQRYDNMIDMECQEDPALLYSGGGDQTDVPRIWVPALHSEFDGGKDIFSSITFTSGVKIHTWFGPSRNRTPAESLFDVESLASKQDDMVAVISKLLAFSLTKYEQVIKPLKKGRSARDGYQVRKMKQHEHIVNLFTSSFQIADQDLKCVVCRTDQVFKLTGADRSILWDAGSSEIWRWVSVKCETSPNARMLARLLLIFCQFGMFLRNPRRNRPQNQLPRQNLL